MTPKEEFETLKSGMLTSYLEYSELLKDFNFEDLHNKDKRLLLTGTNATSLKAGAALRGFILEYVRNRNL